MGSKQNALIYIEKDNTTEAEFMSRNFVDTEIRNRAYINALGAELVMKYLASCDIDVKNVHNIHSNSKILEKYDIADVLLPNIHIDARVIFNEDEIFIPKSHFKLEITPDIYVILKLDKKFELVELLGFIETGKINKRNANADYYFINKNSLRSAEELGKFIKDFTGSTSRNISEEDMLRGRELSISLADHNLTESEEKELLDLLLANDSLRESVLEFDNFETLAFNVVPAMNVKSEQASAAVIDVPEEQDSSENSETGTTDEENENDDGNETSDNSEVDLSDTSLEDEDILLDESFFDDEPAEEPEEDLSNTEEQTTEPAEDLAGEEPENPVESLPEDTEQEISGNTTEPELDFSEDLSGALQEEDLSEPEDLPDNVSDNETGIPAADETVNAAAPDQDKTSNELAQTISDAIVNSLEKGAEAAASTAAAAGIAAAATAGTAAAAKAASTIEAGAAVTNEAIKLAGVAGDVINSGIDKIAENQSKALDHIDYEKTDIAPDTKEIPEHIKAMEGLSTSKIQADMEAEASGQFENPHDINELQEVENNHEELAFEQETVDLGAMETVENTDIFDENLEETVNLSSLKTGAPAETSAEINTTEEFEGMDLPDMSSYTIHEDGTSNMDNLGADIPMMNAEDEHLVDFNMNEISLDDNITLDNMQTEIDSGSSDFGDDDFGTSQPELSANAQDLLSSGELTVGNSAEEQDDIAPVEQNSYEIETPEIAEPAEDTSSANQEEIDDAAEDEISIDSFLAEDEPVQEDETELQADDTEIQEAQPEITEPADSAEEEQQTVEETAQDWIEDTGYDNLNDVEIPQNTEPASVSQEVPQEEMIVEPEQTQEEAVVIENSTVISDKNFKAGEIPIDINNAQIPQYQTDEPIDGLYNENAGISDNTILQTPGRLGAVADTRRTSSGGFIVKMAAGLVVLGIIGAIGFGVAKLFKAPSEETPQPITDDAAPAAPEPVATKEDTLNVNPDNVVNMDNATDALANPQTLKKEQPQQVSQTQTAPKKAIGAASFIEIRKLTWEVPDYISYNQQFKSYFQAAGKSLKLALTSDLLLATDYPYSNEVKVSVSFDKDGAFKAAQVFKSSGSTQIDKIVLQTVNQTLKPLKAPHSVGNDENTTAVLKIYF